MRNSRFIGKDGEREWCRFLRQYEGVEARRTKQHDGADSPDIVSNLAFRGAPVLWEITTSKACRVGTDYLRGKWEQANAGVLDDDYMTAPVVAWKDHGRGWRVTFGINWCEKGELLVTADAGDWMRALGYRLRAGVKA